jgi:hypothetical protein
MSYPLLLAGFESQTFEVEPAGMFSGPKLLVNGQAPQKGPKRGEMILTLDNGSRVIASWKSSFLGDPALIIAGRKIDVLPALKWYQWTWAGLPVVLIFAGGALGGICGAIAFMLNTRVFRSEMSGVEKYILTLLISILAGMLYALLAFLMVSLIRK